MIPSSEWETKSIGLMSSNFNDGGSVAFWSHTNENSTVNKGTILKPGYWNYVDVNRVMNENIGGSLEMLSQWRKSIQTIDEKLHQIRQQQDDQEKPQVKSKT